MQLMLQEKGSFALAIRTPLMVKTLIEPSELLHAIITPSDEMQRELAVTPTNRLISLPFLMECSRTSDDSEEETTTP